MRIIKASNLLEKSLSVFISYFSLNVVLLEVGFYKDNNGE